MVCNNKSGAGHCKYAYAQNVTSQVNPNLKDYKLRNDWTDVAKAIGDNNVWASSKFTKEKVVTKYKEEVTKDKYGKKVVTKKAEKYGYKYTHPWTLAGAEFKLNIPTGTAIRRITFIARIRKTKSKAKVKKPTAYFRVKGIKPDLEDNTKGLKTGWYKGGYYSVSSTEISTTFDDYYWSMDKEDIEKAGIDETNINDVFFGCDLIWDNAEWDGDKGECEVYVKYIRVKIEYDIAKYTLSVYNEADKSVNATASSPYRMSRQGNLTLYVRCRNKTDARGTTRRVRIQPPNGTTITGVSDEYGTYDGQTKIWTVPPKKNLSCELKLFLSVRKNGLSRFHTELTTSDNHDGGSASYYYFIGEKGSLQYNDVLVTTNGELRQYVTSCVDVDIKGISDDTTLVVNTNNDWETGGVWSLNENECSDGVSINSQTNNSVTLTVPNDYRVSLRYCFVPQSSGLQWFLVNTSDTSDITTTGLEIEEAYEYVIGFNNIGGMNSFDFVNHRMASEVVTDQAIIPCISDERDANMVMYECRLNASVWEDLDYIGCIPLEHLHFDPKSTYKDTLLNSTYKNKRYMGKKLATDEDITLNVRLHPQQVTTLQGLIGMDKPIPINANHKCFEGDALNHRGWAEVYAVKTEETNPHWYKCDIDVKYLTHNLNTRFKIDNQPIISDYDSNIPSLMTETHQSGTPLGANNTDIDTGESYFVTDTDGTYYYAEDYIDETDDEMVDFDDTIRNSFTISNGQHIRVTTRNPLTHTSKVDFVWSSVLIDEYNENDVSRIIRLIEKKTNKTVFEYEYDELKVVEDGGDIERVTAEIIYRVLQKDGTFIDYNTSKPIQFRFNPSDVTLEDDDVTLDDDELEVNATGDAHYGSTVSFLLRSGKLSVVDSGFNGREISFDNINLIDGEYYYEVEWINKNDDAETSEIDCTFDFTVQDTILTTEYADKFGKLVISPFPVAKKKVLFTREAEEGTIYYYEDDGEEFSYLVEPYYQYMNGTDLVTNDGVSIFNLDYGYKIVYIQNGLVRLGFNRLNGEMYLGKYDTSLDDYVTICDFQLQKFDDINVNAIDDDKIEIQASDSVFTIYRGHPYIKIKHELEGILIDTLFNRVWAEQVGISGAVELPTYWDLLNEKNLLPSCATSKPKSDCFELTGITHNDRQATTLELSNLSEPELGVEQTIRVDSNQLSEYTDELDLEDTTCSFGDYTVSYESDGIPTSLELLVGKELTQTGESVDLIGKVTDGADFGVKNKTVYFYEFYELDSLRLRVDKSVIQTGDTVSLNATLQDEDASGIKGETVYFYAVMENPKITGVNITSDKSILSYANGDSADITVQLVGDGIANKTVVFKINGSYYDEATTDSNGQCQISYSSEGTGDIVISAEYEDMSESITIEDCDYYNDGTSLTGIVTPSNASSSIVDGSIMYTTSSSGEKNIYYNTQLTSSIDWEFECEIAKIGASQSIAMYVKNSTTATGCWFAYEDSTSKFVGGCTGSSMGNVDVGALAVGDKIKITNISGVLSIYKNTSLIYSKTNNLSGSYYIGHYTNNGRKQYVKNIKINKN